MLHDEDINEYYVYVGSEIRWIVIHGLFISASCNTVWYSLFLLFASKHVCMYYVCMYVWSSANI